VLVLLRALVEHGLVSITALPEHVADESQTAAPPVSMKEVHDRVVTRLTAVSVDAESPYLRLLIIHYYVTLHRAKLLSVPFSASDWLFLHCVLQTHPELATVAQSLISATQEIFVEETTAHPPIVDSLPVRVSVAVEAPPAVLATL
jgi:hypothetical protein